MEVVVIKVCKKCGPLTREMCYERKSGVLICKECVKLASRQNTINASDSYVRQLIKNNVPGLKTIPQKLIEFKRASIHLRKAVVRREHKELEEWIQKRLLKDLGKTIEVTGVEIEYQNKDHRAVARPRHRNVRKVGER